MSQKLVLDSFNKIESELEEVADANTLDHLTKQVSDTLFDVARKCFTLAKRKKAGIKKPRKSPWYNIDCANIKKRLNNLSKLLAKAPKDPHIRGKFITVKKEYLGVRLAS
jgi:hypothetical protein